MLFGFLIKKFVWRQNRITEAKKHRRKKSTKSSTNPSKCSIHSCAIYQMSWDTKYGSMTMAGWHLTIILSNQNGKKSSPRSTTITTARNKSIFFFGALLFNMAFDWICRALQFMLPRTAYRWVYDSVVCVPTWNRGTASKFLPHSFGWPF